MTDKSGETRRVVSLASRVQVTLPTSSGSPSSETCAGVVIEDYADMVIDSGSMGREWAQVHRGAIALDDGRLIFANDDDLTADDPTAS
ncbi:hypothetical protein ACMTN4_00840 (plasmid) [Rhodococcus globerulus]|uniref:hypothetical protein n=1 Tax=Rhodococcus globerulus TaxID=33008 RepID=UPI0039ECDC8D